MCLVTIQKEAFIAESDIIAYKKVHLDNGKHISIYHSFKWEQGKVNKTSLSKKETHVTACYYHDVDTWEYYVKEYPNLKLNEISTGFHAFTKEIDVTMMDPIGTVVVEVLIPKDSHYFVDECNMIVSNQMIMI